jgi:hypothetical protein
MDFEGKHFPDEEEEQGSSKSKLIRKIFFRFLVFCSLAVYIICFARIFSSCDASLLDDVTFSEKAVELYKKDPDNFKTYKINTKDFMEYYGTITISEVVYAETAGEIEIGIKYNKKITDLEKNNVSGEFEDFPLIYRLYDQKGKKFFVCNRINTSKGSYKFERVCFSGVQIDFAENYLNVSEALVSGEDIYFETDETSKGQKYTLEIFNPILEKSDKFVIYDNNTSYKEIKYVPN